MTFLPGLGTVPHSISSFYLNIVWTGGWSLYVHLNFSSDIASFVYREINVTYLSHATQVTTGTHICQSTEIHIQHLCLHPSFIKPKGTIWYLIFKFPSLSGYRIKTIKCGLPSVQVNNSHSLANIPHVCVFMILHTKPYLWAYCIYGLYTHIQTAFRKQNQ